jgi:hypothetical protein
MSYAADIFDAARTRLSTLLGPTYKEHTDLFEVEDISANTLENGYSVVLLDAEERSPYINSIFMQRTMKVVVTHRTYASVDSGKVIVKLGTVYDKESEIIESLRWWIDDTIGLVKALPTTKTKLEKFAGGEDSFLVNTLEFTILYKN